MFRSFDSDAYAFTAIGSGATAYSQNGLNQQINIGGASATWDSKGNLHFDPTSAKSYCYSSENLLTGSGSTCSPPTTTLAYDPALRLYQVAGATTTRFAYTGADAIADYDGSNVLQHRYVLDPATGQPLVQYDGGGTTTRKFMSTDERGSVISQTDSSGVLIGINSYDEYGRPGAANLGRYQYTGQKWIGEAGLYDYKARDYLPHLGVFAQTDPIARWNMLEANPDAPVVLSSLAAQPRPQVLKPRSLSMPNLYAYVSNDPINYSDPTGLINWMAVARSAFSGAVEGAATGAVLGAYAGGVGGSAIGGIGAVPGAIVGAFDGGSIGGIAGAAGGAAHSLAEQWAEEQMKGPKKKK